MTYGSITEKGRIFGGDGGMLVCGQVACGTSTTDGTLDLSSYFNTGVKSVMIRMNGPTAKQVNAVTFSATSTSVSVANDAPAASTTLDFWAWGY